MISFEENVQKNEYRIKNGLRIKFQKIGRE